MKEKEMDKEVLEMLKALSAKVKEKGYDCLVVITERMSHEDMRHVQDVHPNCMSFLLEQSVVPVLAGALVGMSVQSKEHLTFLEELRDVIEHVGKMMDGSNIESPNRQDDNDKYFN